MSNVLALHALDRDKIELIKQTVAKGATDLELDLFMHACQRTGLDPLMKQIYAIKRWSEMDRREVMSFQCGIDGYRLIADRTGQYAGSEEPLYVFDEENHPRSASVTVYKLVGGQPCKFSASARWEEYCQKKRDGEPTSMWKKMPYLMLAKCAEALALRKAFPAELSGVYTHEEMMQADSEPKGVNQTFAQKYPEQAKAIEDKIESAKAMSQSSVMEPTTEEVLTEMAPQEVASPAEPWLAKLRTAHTSADINRVYAAIPDELKQDCHTLYFDRLKEIGKAKK